MMKSCAVRNSLWDLKSEDIQQLETWPQEREMLVTQLQLHPRLPNVLCDIVIGYFGSAYGDALAALGKVYELEDLIESCKSRDRSSLQSAHRIICLLARTIGATVPGVYKRAQIRDTVSNIDRFRSYPERAAYLKRCAMFHRILLTYF